MVVVSSNAVMLSQVASNKTSDSRTSVTVDMNENKKHRITSQIYSKIMYIM